MTGETLGTARVDLIVNTDQFVAGVATMNKSLEGMGKASQSAAKQVADNIAKTNAAARTVSTSANAATSSIEQNSKRQIASLQKQIAFLGASREEQLRWTIAQRTSGDVAANLTKQLDAQVAKLKQTNAALGGSGKTAKELQFALRGLPAQITDIVTGIASGQRPLTILFQQGGQLKDMFGGIVPAARALGGAVAGMINPFTLAAGAVVALGLAWKQGSDEAVNFNKALIVSGNVSGATAMQLEQMAASLDSISGVTQHRAAAALTAVASTGKFTADQFALVAGAALKWEQATGQAVDETIKQFEEIGRDPVKAILALNEAQNFLTRETLKQVESLVQQGRQADAARVAMDAYAASLNSKAGQVTQNLGAIETAWNVVKQTASEAWDAMLGIGRQQTIGQQIAGLQEQIARAQARGFATAGLEAQLKQLQSMPDFSNVRHGGGASNIVNSQDERNRQAAEDEFHQIVESHLSKQKKLEAEIAHIREVGKKAGMDAAAIEEQVTAAKKAAAEKGSRTLKAPNLEPATNRNNLQAFEDQLKKEQGAIANQTQILDANYAARNISAQQYYAEQKRLAQENTDVQTKALEGEIAVLQSRNVKGKLSIENATELAQKEAELAKVRADGATKAQTLDIQEAGLLKQRQQANIAYADALNQQKDALKAELDSQTLRVTVGEREFEIRSRIIQLYRDEAKELLNLARQRDAGDIDPATYQKRVDQLRASVADEVNIVRQGYDQMAQAQAKWSNGALKAFADYRDAANDVAGQTYSIFSDALHGLEDVLTDFFTKGKADWKGFFDGIAAEITRFVIRQQLNKLIKKFIPGMADDGQASNADALKGAASSLAASAGPLYGAAAALSASATALAAAGAGGGGSGLTGASGSSGGGWLSALFGLFTGGGGEQIYAKGGAFLGGREVKAFAYGGVVGSPTYFPMAGGKMGLMGEEKPEAIMPLKRGPDGRLGVVAQVPQSQRPVVINNNTNFNMPSRYSPQTEAQMAQTQQRVASRASSRNR